MGSSITVYMDPESLEQSFHWEGPDLFRMESQYISNIISGNDPVGKIIHKQIDSLESGLLVPKGHVGEKGLDLISPQYLRSVILELYEVAAQILIFDRQAIKDLNIEFDGLIVFNKIQREIAGVILICDRAIERGCNVYWALW